MKFEYGSLAFWFRDLLVGAIIGVVIANVACCAVPLEQSAETLDACEPELSCEGVCCPEESYNVVCNPTDDGGRGLVAQGCFAVCRLPEEVVQCPVLQ